MVFSFKTASGPVAAPPSPVRSDSTPFEEESHEVHEDSTLALASDESPPEEESKSLHGEEEVSILTDNMSVSLSEIVPSSAIALENHTTFYSTHNHCIYFFGGFNNTTKRYCERDAYKLDLNDNVLYYMSGETLFGLQGMQCGVAVVEGMTSQQCDKRSTDNKKSTIVTFIGGVDTVPSSKTKKSIQNCEIDVILQNLKVYELDLDKCEHLWVKMDTQDDSDEQISQPVWTPPTTHPHQHITQGISSDFFTPVDLHSTYEALFHLKGHTCQYDSKKKRFVGFGGISTVMKEIHLPPSGRVLQSSTSHKSSQAYNAFVFYIEEEGKTFTRVRPKGLSPQCVPLPRAFHSSVLYNNRWLFVYGGYGCTSSHHVPYVDLLIHVFDTELNIWLTPLSLPKQANTKGTQYLCLVNDYLVLVGGLFSQNHLTLCHLPSGVWSSAAPSCFETEDDHKKLMVVHHTCSVVQDNALVIIGSYKTKSVMLKVECNVLKESAFTGKYCGELTVVPVRKQLPHCPKPLNEFFGTFSFPSYIDDESNDEEGAMDIGNLFQ